MLPKRGCTSVDVVLLVVDERQSFSSKPGDNRVRNGQLGILQRGKAIRVAADRAKDRFTRDVLDHQHSTHPAEIELFRECDEPRLQLGQVARSSNLNKVLKSHDPKVRVKSRVKQRAPDRRVSRPRPLEVAPAF